MVHNSEMKEVMYAMDNKLVMALDLQFALGLTLLFLHMFFIVVFASLPLVYLWLVFATFQQSFLYSFFLLQKQNEKDNKNKVTNSNHNCNYYLHATTCQNYALRLLLRLVLQLHLNLFCYILYFFLKGLKNNMDIM
jgi:hypothetical protein